MLRCNISDHPYRSRGDPQEALRRIELGERFGAVLARQAVR